ncbi:GNAT family N-acetyltransferase [Massilia atriviolacea]|uniref:GNAT family N-acetyltransferase n=1 Tax=Massilia atriviolacea TaxID=2495579 RepID=UPI0013E05D29|nr:GNAT family N-acetyltransferase [Massilia atriviolacea]
MFTLPAPLLLRAIGADDQAFLSELYASTRDDLAAMAAEPAFLAQLIGMQQRMQSQGYRSAFPDAAYAIVERAGQPIGRLVTEADGARLHLVDLAFTPSARGQGYGGSVLRALQAAAGARGLALTLSVLRANEGAARLYARHGFDTVASDDVQLRMRWSAP